MRVLWISPDLPTVVKFFFSTLFLYSYILQGCDPEPASKPFLRRSDSGHPSMLSQLPSDMFLLFGKLRFCTLAQTNEKNAEVRLGS